MTVVVTVTATMSFSCSYTACSRAPGVLFLLLVLGLVRMVDLTSSDVTRIDVLDLFYTFLVSWFASFRKRVRASTARSLRHALPWGFWGQELLRWGVAEFTAVNSVGSRLLNCAPVSAPSWFVVMAILLTVSICVYTATLVGFGCAYHALRRGNLLRPRASLLKGSRSLPLCMGSVL